MVYFLVALLLIVDVFFWTLWREERKLSTSLRERLLQALADNSGTALPPAEPMGRARVYYLDDRRMAELDDAT